MNKRGLLIAFEGVDGCGKSTQAELAYEFLSHQKERLIEAGLSGRVILTHQPGATNLGHSIRQLLLNPHTSLSINPRAELLLFLADRAQHTEHVLKPLLAAGDVVVCDRGVLSSIAYQGYARRLGPEVVQQLSGWASDGVEPDVQFWIDVPLNVALERDPSSSPEFLEATYQGYLDLYSRSVDGLIVVDGDQPIRAVSQDISILLISVLKRWEQGRLKRWGLRWPIKNASSGLLGCLTSSGITLANTLSESIKRSPNRG